MSPKQDPAAATPPPGDTRAEEARPMPDEDGPHDVPDDKVIEATLPSASASGQTQRSGPT